MIEKAFQKASIAEVLTSKSMEDEDAFVFL